MGWFSKSKDPIAAREADLDREIRQLERRIADLSTGTPRPVAVPKAAAAPRDPRPGARPTPAPAPRPVSAPSVNGVPTDRYNLVEAWQRFAGRFSRAPAAPSGMIRLMAAGSVYGPRPLRYESRIARRRFLLRLGILLLLLYGIAREVFRGH